MVCRCKDRTINIIEGTCTIVQRHGDDSHTDVTRREEAEAKVRESESRFRSFFEESAEAIILLDRDTIIDCNHIVLAREAADRKQMDEGGRVGRFLR
ncbi:MAG: PAS domain-containing protein [Proteobacteria bacterium]|nr:PAS domain-containing protein [Pseudomonadota bacterium]